MRSFQPFAVNPTPVTAQLDGLKVTPRNARGCSSHLQPPRHLRSSLDSLQRSFVETGFCSWCREWNQRPCSYKGKDSATKPYPQGGNNSVVCVLPSVTKVWGSPKLQFTGKTTSLEKSKAWLSCPRQITLVMARVLNNVTANTESQSLWADVFQMWSTYLTPTHPSLLLSAREWPWARMLP